MGQESLGIARDLGATLSARAITVVAGTVLAAWTLLKLRSRLLLASLGSIFLSISAGLIVFGFTPGMFNRLARALGVYYPPLLYMILAVVILMMLNVHLAARVSALDVRCRRIVQELAIQAADRGEQSGKSESESRRLSKPSV
jgi:hypothetical protein